jgi:hypothetical protein
MESRNVAEFPLRHIHSSAPISKSAATKNSGRWRSTSAVARRWRGASTSWTIGAESSVCAESASTRRSARSRPDVCACAAIAQSANATQSETISLLTELRELLEQPLFVGLFADLVNVDVAEDALLVDDEERPFRHPFSSQDAVLFRHVAVRIEIREQRERDPADVLSPSAVHVLAVA